MPNTTHRRGWNDPYPVTRRSASPRSNRLPMTSWDRTWKITMRPRSRTKTIWRSATTRHSRRKYHKSTPTPPTTTRLVIRPRIVSHTVKTAHRVVRNTWERHMAATSKNQIDQSGSTKFTPATSGQPASIQYGFQGMRGRMLALGMPKLRPGGGNNTGIGRLSVNNARKGQ